MSDVTRVPPEVLSAISRARGSTDVCIKDSFDTDEAFPITTKEKRIQASIRERFNNLQPGDLMEDKTIYLGKYTPLSVDRVPLSKTYNVFAAPKDLPTLMTYNQTQECVACLKHWCGYNGANYKNAEDIYDALKTGHYNGEWIIPPRELLTGFPFDAPEQNDSNAIIQPDNLLTHKNKGSFKGSFITTQPDTKSVYPDFYRSSTEHVQNKNYTWYSSFVDNHEHYTNKEFNLMSCRLVRLVEFTLK